MSAGFVWLRALALFVLLPVAASLAQPFEPPTANHALFAKNGGETFFVGTVGKPWTSGTFGCVRSDGWQVHEGLDIRCLKRDRKGEPTDPVLATADGTVAYFSAKPSLSNYGNYVVLRHSIDGLEIYSLYGHLREIRPGLKIGQALKANETIATMGRTTNTREGISKERAHVHFELNLFYNDRFEDFHRKHSPNQRNDQQGGAATHSTRARAHSQGEATPPNALPANPRFPTRPPHDPPCSSQKS